MSDPAELFKSWLRLCLDPRTSSEQLENAAYWESIHSPSQFEIRLAVVKNRGASTELLAKLSMISHLPLQIAIAGHPNISEATAGKLLRQQLRELRITLASNPSIPHFVMEKLSTDFKEIRVRLARNPSITLAIQRRFASEREPGVRLALARNQKCHVSVLKHLAGALEEEIRAEVAKNANTSLGGLRAMAKDKSESVRETILNRALHEFPDDIEIYKTLSGFKNSLVSVKAKEQVEFLELKNKSLSLNDFIDSNPPEFPESTNS